MQLHQIKYLITVAETKSIRKASEKLYVSQQAVSQSIRKLEEEYDVKLINRSVHGVSLTYEGEEVVKLAKPVWTNYLILEDHLKSLNNNTSPAGELIVASITSFHRYVLPKAKVAFMRNYPNVHYSQLPLLTQQVIDAVSSGEADIGFLGVPFQDNVPLLKIPDGLQFVPIQKLSYGVAVSSQSSLSNYRVLSLKSLLDHPIIFLKDQLQDDPEGYPPFQVMKRFGAFRTLIADSEDEYGEMIAENLGVAVVVTGIWEKAQYLGTEVHPIRENIYTYIGYLKCPNSENALHIDRFLDIFERSLNIKDIHLA